MITQSLINFHFSNKTLQNLLIYEKLLKKLLLFYSKIKLTISVCNLVLSHSCFHRLLSWTIFFVCFKDWRGHHLQQKLLFVIHISSFQWFTSFGESCLFIATSIRKLIGQILIFTVSTVGIEPGTSQSTATCSGMWATVPSKSKLFYKWYIL